MRLNACGTFKGHVMRIVEFLVGQDRLESRFHLAFFGLKLGVVLLQQPVVRLGINFGDGYRGLTLAMNFLRLSVTACLASTASL